MNRSFLQIFICGWWLCPELYLRRPFDAHASSRLDASLEMKAKQGVQVQTPVHMIYFLYVSYMPILLKIFEGNNCGFHEYVAAFEHVLSLLLLS